MFSRAACHAGLGLLAPSLSISEIRTAAGSFVTSVTDGFHPRHFRLLLDEGGMCKLLCTAEALGDMPFAHRGYAQQAHWGFQDRGLFRVWPRHVVILFMRGKTAGAITMFSQARAAGRRSTRSGARPSGQSTQPSTWVGCPRYSATTAGKSSRPRTAMCPHPVRRDG